VINQHVTYAKVWALDTRHDQATHPVAPLNSTAIYPIIRSPIKLLETGKTRKPILVTFALRNPRRRGRTHRLHVNASLALRRASSSHLGLRRPSSFSLPILIFSRSPEAWWSQWDCSPSTKRRSLHLLIFGLAQLMSFTTLIILSSLLEPQTWSRCISFDLMAFLNESMLYQSLHHLWNNLQTILNTIVSP